MKIPGRRSQPVQSLGRIDSSLGMQVGRAEGNVANTAAQTIVGSADAISRNIVQPMYEREAASQYAKGEADRAMFLAETESVINNPSGVVKADDIPEGVYYEPFAADGKYRENIPTHEVAQDWYKSALKESQKRALHTMTNGLAIRKMKSDYNTAYVDNYANVLVQAQKRKLSAEKADLGMSVERFVEAGDQKKAEVLILGAIETGVVGPEAGAEKLMAIPGEIDAYKVSRAIHTSTIDQLDGLEDYIYRDYNIDANGDIVLNSDGSKQQNPMSFEQRKTAVKELEARRKALTATVAKEKDDSSERYLNEQLVLLQDGEPLDEAELLDQKYRMTAGDHRVLIVANKAKLTSFKGKSDPAVMSTLQKDVNGLMMPAPGQPINLRRAALIDRINTAVDSQQINATDSWTLIQRVKTAQEIEFKDMDLVVDQIYKKLTRGSKSSVGLNTDAQSVINAADAERALYDAARAEGPAFDPLLWMDKNLSRFHTPNMVKNSAKLDKSMAKVYITRNEDGTLNAPETQSKLREAVRNGTVQDEVAKEVLRMIATETQERQDAEQYQKDKESSSWWSW